MLVIRSSISTMRGAIANAQWTRRLQVDSVQGVRNAGGFQLSDSFGGTFTPNTLTGERLLEAFQNGAITIDAAGTQIDPPGAAPATAITGSMLEINPSNPNFLFWRIPQTVLDNAVAGTDFTLQVDIAEYTFVTDHVIYPADRCTWHQVNHGGSDGYGITNAQFFGLGTTATDIPDPQLGYIGKSGRFVEIAG